MSYENVVQKLQKDEVVLLDGGTGTELQKRGLDMVPGAWCGPVSLKNADVLEKVHLDYIEAGAYHHRQYLRFLENHASGGWL